MARFQWTTCSRSVSVPDVQRSSQRKIAAALSAYDQLIENNTSRIKILDEMAKRIYREWFVDFRYPGHEGVPMVDSETGSDTGGVGSSQSWGGNRVRLRPALKRQSQGGEDRLRLGRRMIGHHRLIDLSEGTRNHCRRRKGTCRVGLLVGSGTSLLLIHYLLDTHQSPTDILLLRHW